MTTKIEPAERFVVGDTDTEHARGDAACRQCWPCYPKSCECGGLMHAEFGDENANCDYWLYTKCDRCGESE